ncbi:LysR family transcriptional regulator [uncultured Caulobacter sp.]|uniref:LysR family transcriptional regulator n=1 Tax=uncultured Caulobacter sp. TaxID=158749 RepID=UPI002615C1FE|nr:LysR family transcriptional regulator [uncultured Caulobacter sp.]
MASLNYNHLRYFWVVAQEGAMTRAARRLNVSQSALSVQLQKLEQQLGVALFDRAGRRLVLTEAGQIALDYANTVFETGEELFDTLKGRSAATHKRLRVGALTTLSRNFQLGFLRPLLARPDVELTVSSGGTRELFARLEERSLDLVLANSPAPLDARSSLRSHLIDAQTVSLVARPGAASSAFDYPAALDGASLVLPGPESEIRRAFDRAMDLAGVTPDVHAEVDDMAMLRLFAREHDGLTLVPPIVVRDELARGDLVEVCQVPGITESFYAIIQNRRFPNPLLSILLAGP